MCSCVWLLTWQLRTHTQVLMPVRYSLYTLAHLSSPRSAIYLVLKIEFDRTGEMAQKLRVLAALSEVLSSIPSNYMVVHNHL